MSDTSSYSNISEISVPKKQSVVHGYIMTILAGIFLVLAVNFQTVVGLFKKDGANTVQASGRATSEEKADISRINMTISHRLADSQQDALKEVSLKSQRLTSFIATLVGAEIAAETPSTSNDIIMIGTKKAVNYASTQSLSVYVTDFSQHQVILKKATELEISTVSPVEFGFTAEKLAAIDEKLLADSLKDAQQNGKKLAGEMGVTLGNPVAIEQKDRNSAYGNISINKDSHGYSFPADSLSEDIRLTTDVDVTYNIKH